MENKRVPEVRFEGFSGEWEERKLNEVAEIIGGGTPSTAVQEYWDGDIDWYSPVEIGKEIYAVGSQRKITSLGLKKSSAKVLPANKTILFTSRAGIGDMAILKKDGATNQGFQSLVVNNNYNTYFVYSIGHKIKEFALKHASGSTFLEISGRQLGKMVLFVPSLEEQTKIGTFFKQLDDTIALHQQELTTLKQTKQGFLQKMFPKEGESVPEVRFSGFTDDWEQRKLREMLAEPVTDGPHETPKLEESGIPFISVDAIVDNQIDFDRKRGYISEETDELYSKKYRPQYHDVFLVKSGSTVGKTAIVETKERFNIWSPLAAMRVGEVSDPYFLYFLLQTRKMQNQVKDKASSGTQPNLGMRELEKFHTQITPNLEEQKKIGAFFQQLDNLITLHQRELEALKKTKKAFLQKMFV
ncbi:restriction endonuclease subunit S [Bacillus paralicheniformis]|uniref:Restriction endonuclease subunit S n=1 Tax=Bacillus haynesii TaxID=1925021 RepID=A0AA90EZE1_9BACI|nr:MULTISPECIES: restriction endonuclease subunit S [Bacillus]POO77343.1 restriction endonuclease subunit S [Bacillus sp. MBGLi97]MCI4128352.1 restriction endonuclease subunit S [Bacillus haynesii]MCY7790364.1 restriction endonuclease subunit S [Bacillus haynesii]MCY7850458.1 restriction endonuclease subunit S [Bacillus haynesii]MCY8039640.1 restriction endonuclease subunit S [Bacillus paralicheniformis]